MLKILKVIIIELNEVMMKISKEKIYLIGNIISVTFVSIVLIWAFVQNDIYTQLFILPFIICALAKLCEYIFLLINKAKFVPICQLIFKISFSIYVLGLLIYAFYYSIKNEAYSSFIFLIPFIIIGIILLRKLIKK